MNPQGKIIHKYLLIHYYITYDYNENNFWVQQEKTLVKAAQRKNRFKLKARKIFLAENILTQNKRKKRHDLQIV